jgi:diacylglycerol kinase family enzyme
MNGRFYGGGMMPTPEQYRLREDGKVSILIFHDVGKLRGLMIFPSIFSGKHLKYTNQMTILEGKTIQVKYNEPAPLQIDGEVVPEVMEYTVRSCVSPAEKAKQDSEMAAV